MTVLQGSPRNNFYNLPDEGVSIGSREWTEVASIAAWFHNAKHRPKCAFFYPNNQHRLPLFSHHHRNLRVLIKELFQLAGYLTACSRILIVHQQWASRLHFIQSSKGIRGPAFGP
jgi:hypothetical protein